MNFLDTPINTIARHEMALAATILRANAPALLTALIALVDCPALNEDEQDEATANAIQRARGSDQGGDWDMNELAQLFADIAKKYEPSVAVGLLGAAHTEGLSDLVAGSLLVTFGLILLWISRRLFLAAKASNNSDDIGYNLGGAILFAVGFGMTFGGIWDLVDPWTWAAIGHPDYWIVKRVMKL